MEFEGPKMPKIPGIDGMMENNHTEILMSILMLSAQKPTGVTREDIEAILMAYGEPELYSMCAELENVEVEGVDIDEDSGLDALVESMDEIDESAFSELEV